jgi:hypothetical protein
VFLRRRQVSAEGDKLFAPPPLRNAKKTRSARSGSAAVGDFATASVDHQPTNERLRRSIVRVVKDQRTIPASDGGTARGGNCLTQAACASHALVATVRVHLYHPVGRCKAPIFGHRADCRKRLGGKELAERQTAA